ncbi:hypothetical protein C2G38_2218259 [Gigaspora rosea]|uniref:Uncharacterized protein n=1 Tax=Gigaspora rosea TaxID=44941 RepID=A0A397U6W5_9GLOM|nr:hypothetical protein C2G38_2218259 [Gigaspora rosea]
MSTTLPILFSIITSNLVSVDNYSFVVGVVAEVITRDVTKAVVGAVVGVVVGAIIYALD